MNSSGSAPEAEMVRLRKDFDRDWLSELSSNRLLAFIFLVCKSKLL